MRRFLAAVACAASCAGAAPQIEIPDDEQVASSPADIARMHDMMCEHFIARTRRELDYCAVQKCDVDELEYISISNDWALTEQCEQRGAFSKEIFSLRLRALEFAANAIDQNPPSSLQSCGTAMREGAKIGKRVLPSCSAHPAEIAAAHVSIQAACAETLPTETDTHSDELDTILDKGRIAYNMNFFQKLWNQFLTASRQLCGDKYTLQTVKTNTPAPPMTSQELQNNSAAKLRCAAAKQKTDTRLRSTNTQARCDSVGLALDLLEIDTDCGQVFPPQDVEQFHKRAGVMMQACSYLHGGDKDPGAHCVEALDDMNNLVRSDIQDGYCHPALNEMYQEKVIAACRNIHGPFFRSLIRWEKSLIAISKAWAKTCRERLKKD